MFETQANHKPKKSHRFTIADFTCNEENDRYICPNGNELKLQAKRARTGNLVFLTYAIKDVTVPSTICLKVHVDASGKEEVYLDTD
ncbi:MAG: hypothetical protein SVM79_08360 [Chloroflexota bacterium]|nr:hypothetical protein [Chloroflexota bacterium]